MAKVSLTCSSPKRKQQSVVLEGIQGHSNEHVELISSAYSSYRLRAADRGPIELGRTIATLAIWSKRG